MKKFCGIILYIVSFAITLFWLYGIWQLINRQDCEGCNYMIKAPEPIWSPEILIFLILLPVIALGLFIIGRKLRK